MDVQPIAVDDVGVVIGRFQVQDLTLGHAGLLRYAMLRHRQVLVLVGYGAALPCAHDPLPVSMRVRMFAAVDGAGWSADNIAFGSGGGLLQKVNRDTCKFAFKCCAIHKQGDVGWLPVTKDPVTDHSKASQRGGRLTSPLMRPVFENGRMLVREDLKTIRERAWAPETVSA